MNIEKLLEEVVDVDHKEKSVLLTSHAIENWSNEEYKAVLDHHFKN